jgi:multisubunit Na+/H+ antiporter MnhB subunit
MLAWFTLPLFTAAAIESTMSSAYQIPNPISVNYSAPLYDILFLIGLPAMALTVLALVASAVARYRQGQGRERQQMKWLLAGVILMAVLVIVGLALSFGAGFPLGDIMVNVSLIGPVLGIGVAMLRHQLYDIDFIIRRTLVYAVVSTLLAGIYFGSVVVLQWLVSAVGGQQSGVVVAVSTLVIAALFSPLRRRVQTTVDRRFYRRKYDAAQTLAHFAATVQDETEISQLQQELAGVVIETMQPIHLSLWLKPEKSTLGKYPPDFGNG